MLEIREMLRQDLGQVAALEKEIFSSPWSEQGFADSLAQQNTIYLVGVEAGKVVAYCGMLTILDEGNITNVAVAAQCRGMGIGKRIVSALLERGRYRSISAFTLEVRQSNYAAIRMYESLGFQNEGIRRNFYEKPTEDAIIMWKWH